MSLHELMRLLQDFGAFIVIVLLAYVVYKVATLIEVMGDKLRREKEL